MKNKVYFYNKKCNFLINSITIIICIIFGIIFFFKFYDIKFFIINLLGKNSFLSNLENFQLDLIIGIFLGVITASPALFRLVLKRLLKLNSYIKHKLYPKLRMSYINIKRKLFIINCFYCFNLKTIKKQNEVTLKILKSIKDNLEDNNTFWIIGESFTGKNIILSNILISLISDKNYYQLFKKFDDKIIYFDFINDNFEEFEKNYQKQKFKNNILIIDNIHWMPNDKLIKLLDSIASFDDRAKIIIVCLREFEEITNDSLISRQLHLKISSKGESFFLNEFTDNSLDFKFGEFKPFYSKMNKYSKIHYFNLYNKLEKEQNNLLNQINDYLEGNLDINNNRHHIILVISCLSLFTGNFKKDHLINFVKGKISKHKINALLSDLHSCGFIDRSPYGFGERYLFNSKIAKNYFEIAYSIAICRNLIKNVLEKTYNLYKNSNDYLGFLYGCFVETNIEKQSALFDNIAININFKILLEEMEFLESTNACLSTSYLREFGILYDRTGRFVESREKFKKLIEISCNNHNPELAVESYYRLLQIDHTVHNKYYELKQYNIKSVYLNLLKDYWELHMNMHMGIFSLEKFFTMLEQSQKLCNNEKLYNNYDCLHLLRRVYFDSYRIFYLEGSLNGQIMIEIAKKGDRVKNYLTNYLNEFELYNRKFTALFLLINDVLFSSKLDRSIIDQNTYNFFLKDTDLHYEDMSNIKKIQKVAINICENLESEFERVGDKTFNFIRYYRTELLIIENDPRCKSLIKQYKDFGIDEIEYRLYADFIELKYYLAQFLNLENISNQNGEDYNSSQTMVKNQLQIINNYFDEGYKNNYAYMRYLTYSLLFDILRKILNRDNLKFALDFAINNSYKREEKLLKIILDAEFQKSYGWYRDIILYYPIVPQ